MSDKVFIDSGEILNWIPENETGDIEGTRRSVQVMEDLLEEHTKMGILVDLSKAQRPNREQREIIINAIRSHTSNINKVALFGETPLIKTVAFFIINASRFENMKFFSNRSEALAWLK